MRENVEECATCRFYVDMAAAGAPPGQGICRRNPPIGFPGPEGVFSTWPPVSIERDWCGDYEYGATVQRPFVPPAPVMPTEAEQLLAGLPVNGGLIVPGGRP